MYHHRTYGTWGHSCTDVLCDKLSSEPASHMSSRLVMVATGTASTSIEWLILWRAPFFFWFIFEVWRHQKPDFGLSCQTIFPCVSSRTRPSRKRDHCSAERSFYSDQGADCSRLQLKPSLPRFQGSTAASTAFGKGCGDASGLSFLLQGVAVLVRCSCNPTCSASHAESCMCTGFHALSTDRAEFSVHCHADYAGARSTRLPLALSKRRRHL